MLLGSVGTDLWGKVTSPSYLTMAITHCNIRELLFFSGGAVSAPILNPHDPTELFLFLYCGSFLVKEIVYTDLGRVGDDDLKIGGGFYGKLRISFGDSSLLCNF